MADSLQDVAFQKLKVAYPALANAGLMDYLYAHLQANATMVHLLGASAFYSQDASAESWNDAADAYYEAL